MFQAIKQVDAVVSAVKEVLGDAFIPGVKVELSKDQRSKVIDMVCAGLTEGTVQFSEAAKAKHSQAGTIRTYASGLTTNWLNKSKELNGNIEYAPINPGSRSNPELKQASKQAIELKAHLESVGQDSTAVTAYIAALEAAKPTKSKTLDVSALPPELQALVG
jgi:hypothetical protein